MQTDATTPNSVAQTMLGVVVSVVCKRMQQLPTSLGPAVHRGKDTTHKSLWSMRNERALPQQCWKSCANGSNIVALLFGDHGTKEMLGVIGWKVWPVSKFAQQHATTSNNMQQGEQTDATCNIQQCCVRLHAASESYLLFFPQTWTQKQDFPIWCSCSLKYCRKARSTKWKTTTLNFHHSTISV